MVAFIPKYVSHVVYLELVLSRKLGSLKDHDRSLVVFLLTSAHLLISALIKAVYVTLI